MVQICLCCSWPSTCCRCTLPCAAAAYSAINHLQMLPCIPCACRVSWLQEYACEDCRPCMISKHLVFKRLLCYQLFCILVLYHPIIHRYLLPFQLPPTSHVFQPGRADCLVCLQYMLAFNPCQHCSFVPTRVVVFCHAAVSRHARMGTCAWHEVPLESAVLQIMRVCADH
jgi:hypothetical protein